ncbi:MAG TPA: response regulator transcription factor, partial [Acidimicrobiales bacterium]|nr:response regulator transcription factor [Acidimicrobiales bacterium]
MLVEDNADVRRGVAAVLNATEDLQVCAEAATVAEAGPMALAIAPDVVIVDLRLPDGSGVEAGRDVRAAQPDIRVLLLTSASEEDALVASVLTGASGFLVKQLLGDDLVATVRALAEGETLIDLTDFTALAPVQRRLATCGPEEAHLVSLVVSGLTDVQIAQEYGVPAVQVRERVASVLDRMGAGRTARR